MMAEPELHEEYYAEVALPLPLEQTFSYRVPEELRARARLGAQVVVPFRARLVTGFIVGTGGRPALDRAIEIKAIHEVIEGEPLVTPELLELANWIAQHYLASLGEVLHSVFPPGVARVAERRVRLAHAPGAQALAAADRGRGGAAAHMLRLLAERDDRSLASLNRALGSAGTRRALGTLKALGLVEEVSGLRARAAAPRLVRVVSLADEAAAREGLPALARRAPAQARCVEILLARKECEAPHLLRAARATGGALRALRRAAILREKMRPVVRRPPELGDDSPLPHPTLTSHQEVACAALAEAIRARRHETFLLHGITGSGKTEVYLRAIEEVLRQGRTAIVLVPEIALAPQTVRQVLARFGNTVAVLHSGLAAGERFDAWHQVRRGEVSVVVGARSAVFAPLDRLGLVVVDEEHESSYKQDETPRYHGRPAAIMRARFAGAVALLGSATPSLESYWNAREGKYRLLTLPERVEAGELPVARIVDLRHEGGHAPHVISTVLRDRISERLARKEQVILFLNRRGFSPYVQCRDCGWVGRCASCDLTLTYHQAGHLLRCHYCDHSEPAPAACPGCRGVRLDFKGVGTQRVEAEIARLFPEARVERMDLDSTRRRGAHAALYRRMLAGEIDVLLGTQMVAKGLHFPRVGLVGVVNADVALHLPDFRAAEKTFQVVAQVAGRAGRGGVPGEAVIQTFAPEHHGIQFASLHDYHGFYEREIAAREELVYPPFGRLVRFVLRGEDAALVESEGARLREILAGELTRADAGWQKHGRTWFRIVGPAEAPLARVRGLYRRHLVVKCGRWESLSDLVREAGRRFRAEAAGAARTGVELVTDVDPMDML